MSTTRTRDLLLLLLLAALQVSCSGSGELGVGFYDLTCPPAEPLVRQVVDAAYANDSSVTAGLLRLHFHDCFVRGCDASVLLDSTTYNSGEKDAGPNESLHGFDVINDAKEAVEAACPGVVSCADILAFAARDSAALVGDIAYEVPAGRRDGVVSTATEAELNLPSPYYDAAQLVVNFASKGLTAEDLVILSGAHSFGEAHCTVFYDRLYNYSSSSEADPTLSTGYADLLRSVCPYNSTESTNTTVGLDVVTPDVLDNKYYAAVKLGLGLLKSDQALMEDEDLSAAVEEYARSNKGWVANFGRAMVRMGNVQVLTGLEGEIRNSCSRVNSPRGAGVASAGNGYGRRQGLAASS